MLSPPKMDKHTYGGRNAMTRICIKMTFVGCAILWMSGCDGRSLQQWIAGAPKGETIEHRIAAAQAAAIAAGTPNLQNLNADTKTDLNAEFKYYTVVQQLFSQGKYEDLDKLADSLRQTKATFSGGRSKLKIFYSGLLYFPNRKSPNDLDWQTRIETLKQWRTQKPDSITAAVSLAEAYYYYGWYARGADYANKVSASQWALFDERLKSAKQILDEASHLKAKCPQWYLVMIDIGRSQGGDADQEAAVFNQAITFEPAYRAYYIQYAQYLMPKWSGNEGDWEQFAERMYVQLGPKQGPITYFRIAINMNCCDYDASAIFTKAKLSWAKVKTGCQLTEQVYGSSLENLN